MDNKTKILLIGGVAAIGAWWWFTTGSAQASLAAHAPATPVPTPGNAPTSLTPADTADQVTTPSISTSGGTVAVAPAQAAVSANAAMMTALLAWAQQTKNPTLYASWIDQLGPSDIASLYNILTTYWAGTAPATPAQIAYWNGLVAAYPFLQSGGVGCANFACN
jgi:hypothetical protein